ncbi:MAG: LysR family transcriptional regulator [Dermatophilaceae bacterium]
MRDLEPQSVLVFRQVARLGSMTAAARELGWTQPAISQHVKRLERQLGTPLLLRSGRSTRLTEAGQVLAMHADRLAAVLDMAEREVAHLVDRSTGRVRLHGFPSALATIVPGALSLLAQEHPGIEVQTTEALPLSADEAVRSGETDIAVLFRYETVQAHRRHVSEQGHPGSHQERRSIDGRDDRRPGHGVRRVERGSDDLLTVPLLREHVYVVLPRGDPLGARPEVPLSALSDRAWVAGCTTCRQHLVASALAVGFQPQVQHETDDYLVTQSLVAAGLGVALLPARALAASRHPGVDTAPVADKLFAVDAVLHRDASRVPSAAAVLAALKHAAAQARPPGA